MRTMPVATAEPMKPSYSIETAYLFLQEFKLLEKEAEHKLLNLMEEDPEVLSTFGEITHILKEKGREIVRSSRRIKAAESVEKLPIPSWVSARISNMLKNFTDENREARSLIPSVINILRFDFRQTLAEIENVNQMQSLKAALERDLAELNE